MEHLWPLARLAAHCMGGLSHAVLSLLDQRGSCSCFFLDFEATGVDPLFDRICEFAVIAAVGPPSAPPPCFSTVISVDAAFLEQHGAKAAEIHGIPPEEIAQGPDFAYAFGEFLSFVDGLLNTALETDTQSDDDDGEGEPDMPRLAEVPPTVVIASHNGQKYDFTMLLCECNRNKLPWQRMQQWLFVDTLHIFDAVRMDLGGCKKLQCVSRFCSGDHGLAAHRALWSFEPSLNTLLNAYPFHSRSW